MSADSILAHALRYLHETLAAGEHTDPMTGKTTVLDAEKSAQLQELADRLVDDIASDS